MAYVDAKLYLSSDQAITATAASEDVIDWGAAESIGIGGGTEVRLVVEVKTAFDSSADDGTLTIAWVDDTAAPIDGSSTVVVQSEAIAEATLVAGFRKELPIPAEAHGRYGGVYYTVAGSGNFTAGVVNAWLEAR